MSIDHLKQFQPEFENGKIIYFTEQDNYTILYDPNVGSVNRFETCILCTKATAISNLFVTKMGGTKNRVALAMCVKCSTSHRRLYSIFHSNNSYSKIIKKYGYATMTACDVALFDHHTTMCHIFNKTDIFRGCHFDTLMIAREFVFRDLVSDLWQSIVLCYLFIP